jgi:glycosyltransferase involved in cell wall biosynthesis
MYLLSIVIPVHEEGSYILATLERITRSVKTEFECIIVADNNSDSTIPFILDFQRKDPRFRFELNQIAVGPAGAIKQGIRFAKGEMIAVVSGDGSDDISQLDSLAGLVERGVSVAVASRYMKGGQLVGAPLLKAWLSRLAGITLYLFARLGTRDATNNFKVYSNEFINSIVIESNYGFEIGLELTTKAKLLNFRIAEIPTIWIERTEGESKFPLISSLRFYLKWYLKAIFRIKPKRI